MKIHFAQRLLNDWDEDMDGDFIVTDSITFSIGGYTYQIGSTLEDGEETEENIWFSRRRDEDHNQSNDTYENVERWVPEMGSEGYAEYNRKTNFKLLR